MRANKLYFLFLLFFVAMDCLAQTKIATKPPVEGIRIGWDYRSLSKVSAAGGGYARLIKLDDNSLICVYEIGGSTVCVKRVAGGKTWSQPITIASHEGGVAMAVPDILQLKDQSLLACYNPRPGRGADTSKYFGIKTKKSYDGGQTWTDERTLYQADNKFDNGCWEPSAIQLPDGEIQLYFANEGDYRTSNEQNISMVTSKDGGLTWTTTPKIVSFRSNSRDGMPVPVLLQNGKEIVFAIEDNGFKNFKPYIIRTTVNNSWQKTVGAMDPERTYALTDKIPDSIYAGAPYLRQLKTGETILSYQGTEGRKNDMNHSEMKVVIGDDRAMNFNRKTVPFKLAPDKSGLWNSLSVLDKYTVAALTSTNNYTIGRGGEVWMIEGTIVPELSAKKQVFTVDGKIDADEWGDNVDVFIGQNGIRQISAGMVYDDKYLYVFGKISDKAVAQSGMEIYLDPQNKHLVAPDKGIYKITISGENKLNVYEGKNGEWIAGKEKGIKSALTYLMSGYVIETAIPWVLIGGKPPLNKRIGFNVALVASDGYTENISTNEADKPFTWCTLKLK
jgi:hypothetical protein